MSASFSTGLIGGNFVIGDNRIISVSPSSGDNTDGQHLTIQSGQGTGTGTGGSIMFQTASGGSSGSSVNDLATKLTITSEGIQVAGTGSMSDTLSLTKSSDTGLSVTSNATIGGNLTVTGNLTVSGTSTTITSSTLEVNDKNIVIGNVSGPTNSTADGGGITLKANGDKTIIYTNSGDRWTSNIHWNIASGKAYQINGTAILTSTALGSTVVGSSLTSVGTIGTGVWNATAIADNYIASAATWNAKQSALTFGKSSGNTLKSEEALVTNDVLLMGTNNVKGRTYSELKTDLSLNSVENTALSTWAGSTNITSVGTITTGTWSATTIAVAKGGTGQTTYTAGQLLIGNSSNGLTKSTLTAGSNVTVTNGNGSITIASTDTNTTYTGGTGITLSSTTFNLDTASDSALGGVKVGSGLAIDGSGVLSATSSGKWSGSTDIYYNSGDVGIGTTNPGDKLEIKGDAVNMGAIRISSYSTTDKTFELRIRDDTTSSYPLHIGPMSTFNGINIKNSNGYVGIGTSNPSGTLHIKDGNFRIEQTGTNNNTIIINPNNHNNGADIEVYQSDSASTKKKLCLNPYGGNVGIGNTNPSYKLDVSGTGRFTGDLTAGANLTVTGNLIVNGTTTTVNSTTMTVDDPIITLGGDTAPGNNDNKDRGVEFRYYDGSAKVGFMGWDDSAGGFVVLKDATNSSEVFSGTAAELKVGSLTIGSGGSLSIESGGSVSNLSSLLTTSSALSSLSNVATTTPSTNQALAWNGSAWAPGGSISVSYLVNNLSSGSGIWFDYANTMRFITNNTEKMIIKPDGKVGIGTTSPQAKLDVVGSAVFKSVDATNTGGILLMPDDQGSTTNGNSSGRIFFNETQNSMNNYGFSLGFNGGDDDDILNWKADTFNINCHDNSVDGLTVLTILRSNGNVGIGTTSPKCALEVHGGSGSNDEVLILSNKKDEDASEYHSIFTLGGHHYDVYYNSTIQDGKSTSNGSDFHINYYSGGDVSLCGNGNGKVGIGTTSPDAILHLKSTGDVVLKLEADSDNSGENDNPMIHMTQDGNLSDFYIGMNGDAGGAFTGALDNVAYLSSAVYLQFATNGASRMTILQNGNVGIGTTSPSYALEINGTTSIGPSGGGAGFLLNLGVTGTAKGGSSNYRAGYLHGSGSIITLLNQEDGQIRIGSGNSINGITVDTNNNVGIGTTSPGSVLDVNGKVTCTDFQNTSDRRIKENIIQANDVDVMDKINNLNLKVYTYTEEYRKSIPEGELSTSPVFGWIAQEVKNTYSDAVVVQKNTIGDTEYEDFHYIKKGKLYDLAVAGVKILHKKNKDLETKVASLESELAAIKAHLGL
jgi:hypothetical protein